MPVKLKPRNPAAGRFSILGAVVFLAMGIAAVAFAAGLYVQAGFGLAASAIAGVVLFLVMASSHAAFMGAHGTRAVSERMAAIEEAFAQLAQDIERVSRAGEASAQLETLAQRVEGLKRLIDKADEIRSFAEAAAQVNRLTGETERLDARIEALRSQFAIGSKQRHEELTAELKMVETLVKQMAERFAAERAAPLPEAAPWAPARLAATAAPAVAAGPAPGGGAPADVPQVRPEDVDALMIEEIRRSIEANRIELYLQPIMQLPQRRVRYYEAFSRLRNEREQIILPKDYLHLAESAGVMPVIDNVMLFRSVQVLRRLEQRSSARGVFCNISVHSLLDPEFFTEFIAFMEQNRELSQSMFFEFSQGVIDGCGPVEAESLNNLAALGFRFSLDQVTNLDVDFQALHARGFRTIKIAADIFLHGMAAAGARIHPADMGSYLDRFGMQLIVEKIEDEPSLASLLDLDVRLGQGYVFSEPRPVRPEVFGAKDKAQAA